jgi:signal transduction histidine kinase
VLSFSLLFSVFVALFVFILGSATLFRNLQSSLNRIFMFFCIFLAGWLVSNNLASSLDSTTAVALIANRLVFFFGGLSLVATLLFLKILLKQSIKLHDQMLLLTVTSISILSLSNLVVINVSPNDLTYNISFGYMAYIYFFLVLAITTSLIILLSKNKAKQDYLLKEKLYVIRFSFVLGISLIIITNIIMPFVFQNFSLTEFGSLASLSFVFGLSYSIVKHKLFDLRLVVARSLSYISIIVFFLALYGASISLLANKLFIKYPTIANLVPVVMSILLAFSLTSIKKWFDDKTAKIFFRDRYDPQDLLDRLNKISVSNYEVESLLVRSSELIEDAIKSSFCTFVIRETPYVKSRVVGDNKTEITEKEIDALEEYLPRIKLKSISAYIDTSEDNIRKVNRILKSKDVDILIKMVSPEQPSLQGVGYMLLGPKKSGNMYSSQDLKILEIVSNELLIATENALRFEEIEQFNVTLQKKIDSATNELKKSNEKLKALDEAKDEFISMASHQLRTPLTSVKGYLSMVLEGDAGEVNKNQETMLQQAFFSSQRMVYLISDLLNVSRLKTGKFVIEAKPTYLPDVVESEISQLHETAKSRDLELIFDKPKDFPTIDLDETKLRQVIMNFTDNAIYYTPAGGKIKLTLAADDSKIEFKVTDNGIGVPKNEQHNLFTKFYRAGNAKKARPDGTGLGLFMAKKVIIASGGALVFESQEGKGSTFGFTFPLSQP